MNQMCARVSLTIPSTKASWMLLLVGFTTSTIVSPNTVKFPPEGENVKSGGLVAFNPSCIAQLGNTLHICDNEIGEPKPIHILVKYTTKLVLSITGPPGPLMAATTGPPSLVGLGLGLKARAILISAYKATLA